MNTSSSLLGLHILLTFTTEKLSSLTDYNSYALEIDTLLQKFDLEKVGTTFFIFDNSSFTSAICLKESHLCIHTWPEIKTVTLDVYLCNYQKDNTETVRKIANKIVSFFEGKISTKHEIFR